ncbi:MAG: DNA polymerase epsilon subunit 3, partial [Paramarteilia canceri]
LAQGSSLSHESKGVINRATSIFILFITTKAAELIEPDRQQILTADHIRRSLNQNGFSHFTEYCDKFVQNYNSNKQLKQAEKVAASDKNKEKSEPQGETKQEKETPEDLASLEEESKSPEQYF